jgi:hypothetical protein
VPHLEERLGSSVGFFHGRLNAKQREHLLEEFANEDGPRLLVISIRAGGRGSTCRPRTTSSTSTAGGTRRRAAGHRPRHRFGQRKPVFVHSLICTGRWRSGSTRCSTRSASSRRR